MRVLVVTTSYPRRPEDIDGVFVHDQVEALRSAGHQVDVVAPSSCHHFGIAYGAGIVNNLRAAPWKILVLPLFLASFARAARRAARNVDVVHAHWLPSLLPALATRRPIVLQLWGSDAALALRVRWLARLLVRRARLVVCGSRDLAEAATELGATDVRLIPNGIELPDDPGEPEQPFHVLYVGRLSEEKGVRDLAAAAHGLPLVVVGDGPLRELLPGAIGFVPPDRVGEWYRRAAVVVVPSRREGFGVVAREAMAYGRAVVATDVGGLRDVVEDEVTGLVVPPGDPAALRDALERLLDDPALCRRLGAEARERVARDLSWSATVAGLTAAYEDAIAG